MAATGKTPILLYGSTTATNQPSAGNLTNSSDGCEIAINVADKNLFFKDSTNAVNTVPIRQSSASSDGWLSSTDWTTFNNKSPAAGSSSITTVGTITSGTWHGATIGTGYGGTGLTSFTSGGIVYASSTSALTTSTALTFDTASLINTAGGFRSTVGGIDGIIGAGSFVTGVYGIGTVTNYPVVIAPYLTESVRFHTSGGVSIGNTTDPGATNLSVTGTVSNSGETVNGTLWMKDASQIQIGYNAYRASIYNNGAGPLILTPTSGYGITLNSSAVANGDFSPYSCYPQSDNAYTCGTSAKRWSVVYAATGTINTSDERTKDDITTNLAPELKAWAKVEYCKFKYKDAIQRKGDGARWHIGLIAQKVKEAFESEGLNAFDYGLLCYDEWEDEYEIQIDEEGNETGRTLITKAGNLYGIRYEEALAMECAYLRSMLNK